MNRTLLLLGLAIGVCIVMSVVAVVLKLTAALGLIVAAGLAALGLGLWLLWRRRRGPYG